MIMNNFKRGSMVSRFQKGFSLVELLVVIAIIGILAAVGITAYSGYTKNAKAKATLSQFSAVEAVINAEMARCAVGEGNMIWGTAEHTTPVLGDNDATPDVVEDDFDTGATTPVDYAADACSDAFPPDHTNIASYINTGLPDSLGMKNPYNADANFATVGTLNTPSAVLGGMIIFCGADGGTNKCQLNVFHKVTSGGDQKLSIEILEY